MPEELEVVETGLEPLPTARSLDDMAYQAIKEAILAGRFKGGSSLIEATLAAQLGVSKTPVRSALRRLEAEGFVEKVPYGGTYVAEVSFESLRDLYAVRAVLEGLAVRLATPLYTEADLAEAEALLAATEEAWRAGDAGRGRDLGRDWHTLLRRPLRNQFLTTILDLLKDHIERGRYLTSMDLTSARNSMREHEEVLAAIKARDAELAEQRMRWHLARVIEDFASLGGGE